MKNLLSEAAVIAFFLLVQYPVIQTMTRIKGRGWMFRWRNQLTQGQL